MTTRVCFDVAIVGGGPAGAAAAIMLAHGGWSVAVVEARRRHGVKTCGHCLNPRARNVLERLGMWPSVEAMAAGRTGRIVLHETERRPLPLDHVDGLGAAGLVVRRAELDQLLLDEAAAAGAEVLQPAAVSGVDVRHRRAVVSLAANQTLRARVVIGADGLRSATASALGLAPRPSAGGGYGFSFSVSRDPGDGLDACGVNMFLGRAGYLGAVHQRPGQLHVAALVRVPRKGRASDPVSFARSMAADHVALRSIGLDTITRGDMDGFAAAGPMPWRPRAVACGGGCLVGDAAGYVEPLTGEGMTWALESASLLSGVLLEGRRGAWSPSTATEYARRYRRGLAHRQRRCRWVTRGIRHRMLTSLVWSAPSLAAAVGRSVCAGARPPSGAAA